jgi:hypothetical protein
MKIKRLALIHSNFLTINRDTFANIEFEYIIIFLLEFYLSYNNIACIIIEYCVLYLDIFRLNTINIVSFQTNLNLMRVKHIGSFVWRMLLDWIIGCIKGVHIPIKTFVDTDSKCLERVINLSKLPLDDRLPLAEYFRIVRQVTCALNYI